MPLALVSMNAGCYATSIIRFMGAIIMFIKFAGVVLVAWFIIAGITGSLELWHSGVIIAGVALLIV